MKKSLIDLPQICLAVSLIFFLSLFTTYLRAESFGQLLEKEMLANKTTLSAFSSAAYEVTKKNYDAAITIFEEITVHNPNTLTGWYAYNCTLIKRKDAEGIEKHNQRVSKHIELTKQLLTNDRYTSISPVLKSFLAQEYMSLGNIAEAKANAVQAIQGIKPDSPDAYTLWQAKKLLGKIYETENNWELAKQTYKELIPTVKDKVWKQIIQTDYIKVLIKLGEKEEAKKILDESGIGAQNPQLVEQIK
jgi:tetratricopeptide (TPR) repeat protein